MGKLGLALLVCALTVRVLPGCSCAPIAFGPACQLIGRTPVVFVGTVFRAEPDETMPDDPSARVYRVRVDKIYKGLPAGTREITLNPENFTSCRTEYSVGEQYLIFAAAPPLRGSERQTYLAGGCSGSRRIEWAREDLAFLDEFAAGQSQTRVYGKILQWVDSFDRQDSDEKVPVAGARVTLRSKSYQWKAAAGQDGAYSFLGLQPGEYAIAATDPRTGFAAEPQHVELSVGGCAEQFIQLPSHTELSGVALQYNGLAARKTRIELLRRSTTGKWYGTYQFSSQTDKAGRFKFEGIPTGEYLLGYELWGQQPAIDSPIPTTYYPGVANEPEATVIRLDANQKVRNAALKLRRPDTPRRLTVLISLPNGSPPGKHLLQIFANHQLVRSIGGIPLGGQFTSSEANK